MNKYKVRYQGRVEEILCEGTSPRTAAESFLENVAFKPIPIEVWNDRWIVFDSHISEYQEKEKTKNQEKVTESNQQNFNEGSRDAISSSKDQTQEEILKQLKQINWGIRVGFLFIMLVVTGIIKPGIFG